MTLGDYVMIEGILGLVALMALIGWLIRRAERPPRPPVRRGRRDADIDWDELEAAEREVRDLDRLDQTEDLGDDWGPGVPRPPERL